MRTDPLALIRRLRGEGVKLSADAGQLRVFARKGALDPATVQALRDHKADVLAWLEVLDGPPAQQLPKASADGRPVPATDGQLGMWLLAERGLGDAYHVAAGLQLDGALDVGALQQAWAAAVQRHAGLRTRLVERDGAVWQHADVHGTAMAFADAGSVGADAQAQDLLQRFAAPAFDLANEAPVRISLLEQHERRHLLLICLHHAAIDGWSLRQLLNEIARDYARAQQGEPIPTRPACRDLADLAFWQQQRLTQGMDGPALSHWCGRLAPLDSPLHLGERVAPQGDRRAGHRLFELPVPLARALHDLSASSGITLYHWLLASFKLLLAKYGGSRDVALLVPVANRDALGVQDLIGLLSNTVLSVSQVDGALSMREFAQREAQATIEALAHHAVPFDRVVRHCRAQGVEVPAQLMFSLQTVSEDDLALGQVQAALLRHQPLNAKFDLTLTIEQRGQRLTGVIEYRQALFERCQIDALAHAHAYLLGQVVQAPDQPMARFALAAPRPEPYAAVADGVPTTIQQIAAQAARTPASVALAQGGRAMSYGELWRRVEIAAARLHEAGVRPGDPVGVLLPPGPAIAVGALAALAVGAAYAPLDPNQPSDRLAHMVEDAGLVAVFAQPGSAPVGSAAWLPLTGTEEVGRVGNTPFVPHAADPLAPAYLIFTSGSTGLPKAARVHQRGLTQLLQWYCESCVDAQTRALVISNSSFDLTQKNLLAPLMMGARVVWPDSARFEPRAIVRALQAEHATLVNCTPTAFQALLASTEAESHAALCSLRTVVLGGEPIALEPLRRWQRSRPAEQKVRIVNSYGPTECADVVAWETLPDDLETAIAPVAIGRAVPGCLLDVVDSDGQPLPDGAVGELWIDGDCVGLGYLRRDELTRRVFRPGGHGVTGRRYSSGDFAKRLPDGRFVYLGRRDQQLKFNGHRIELGEIEAALLAQPRIVQAAVAPRSDARGNNLLVAFCALHDGTVLDESALRRALAAVLAPSHLPNRYVQLSRLPLTRSGKIDRNALPAELSEPPPAGNAGPTVQLNPFERRLAEIWQSLLGCLRLPGPQDGFLALGGHSLLAIQMIAQARKLLGVEWSVQQVLDSPTLAALAATAAHDGSATIDPIVPVARGSTAPLSFAQQRLWFLDRIEGLGAAYHIAGAIRLTGLLDASALARALDTIVARHEVLRTRFDPSDTSIVARRVVPADSSDFRLQRIDLSGLEADPAAQQAQLRRHAQDAAAEPFDLSSDAPLRARLLTLGRREHVLLVTLHHIVSDGWSTGVLVRELGALYDAYTRGLPDPLAPLPLQYADYAHWQRLPAQVERHEQQLRYWRRQLAGVPQVHGLPLDQARPAQQRFVGGQHCSQLEPVLAARLGGFCRERAATLFMGLHAAFSALLARFSGEADIVVGTPVANREQPEVYGLIGLFVNTLVLRADLSDRPSFAALLDQCRRTCLDAQANQQLPFDRLVEALQPQRSLGHTPLFQVMLSMQPHAEAGLGLPGLEVQMLDLERNLAQFDLSLDVTEADNGLRLRWEYSADLWAADSIARLSRGFEHLLTGMLDESTRPIDQIPLLDAAGQERMWRLGQGEQLELPGLCLHHIFEAQASRHPDAPAAVDAAGTTSYRALDQQAEHLARRLLAAGVAAQDRVGVCLPPVSGLLTSLVALWKAAAVYVPLSPDHPDEHLRRIIEDAGIRHVITSAQQAPVLARLQSGSRPELLLIDDRPESAACDGAARPLPVSDPEQAAYQMYTSGSTGAPKGVVVSHRNVVSYLTAARSLYALGPASRVLQFANISFDIFVEEVCLSLLSGGSLHLRGGSEVPAPDPFWRGVASGELNVLSLPTAYWHMLCDALSAEHAAIAARHLKACIVGGEAMRTDASRRWQSAMPATVALFNTYGPTETTIIATADRVDGDAGRAPTIGRPLANVQCYVLDTAGNLVPTGVIGELFIGGPAVAHGYWRQDALTTRHFLANRFDPTPGSRCYRTGDMASWGADGRLRYHGRCDQQVKVRGFRVELGDIESALRALPAVRDACVIALDQGGDSARLAAYVVCGDPALDTVTVRRQLALALPDYMLPAAVARLDALPLTPNGKVDRKSLPKPIFDTPERFVAPASVHERLLATLWEDLLQPGRPVSSTDDFFSLGGHSLLALKVVRLLRERLNCDVGVDLIFRHPTLAELARAVAARATEQGRCATPAIPVLAESQLVPLTAMQRRQWFLFRLEGPSAAYNMAGAYRLEGRLNGAALCDALRDVVERHWILRSHLARTEGADLPQLAVGAVERAPVDVAACTAAQVSARIAGFVGYRFDLSADPLSRFELLQVDDGRRYLLANVHHIACDGLSLRTLLRDLTQAYAARVLGGSPWHPGRTVQFAELAMAQARARDETRHREALAQLVAALRGAPSESALPLDAPRSASADRTAQRETFAWDAALTARIHRLAGLYRSTTFNVLLASWAWVMACQRRQDELVIGVPFACRDQPGSDDVIGPLLNTLAVRIDCAAADSFAALLAHTAASLAFARDRRDVPFEDLVDAINPPRSPSISPLFQVQFVLDPDGDDTVAFEGFEAHPLDQAESGGALSAKYDLNIHVLDGGSTLRGYVDYRGALYHRQSVRSAIDAWRFLLDQVCHQPESALNALSLVTADGARAMARRLESVDPTLPLDMPVHRLFEQQTDATPDAPALDGGAQGSLGYRELDTRANQLARRLIESGVGPREQVAVAQRRGVSRVITLLAILKAGAAYLPVDPDWPGARRTLVLDQVDCRFLVVDAGLAAELKGARSRGGVLRQIPPYGASDALRPAQRPGIDVAATDPCYEMFTSGSTGVPKGVVIKHAGVTHDLVFLNRKLGLGPGHRVLQLTAFSFDPSVRDLFATLGSGACAVLVDDESARHPARIVDRLCRSGVSHVLSMVPTMLRALLAEAADSPLASSLQVLMLNGERLRGDDCARARQVFGQHLRILNQYGPTETTMTSATHEVGEDDLQALTVPLGRPNPNTALWLMDPHRRPLPPGAIGEIWIAGPGLAAGYENLLEQTASAFVETRLPHEDSPRRFYRTGDLGRWRTDDVLSFLGRIDFQVKLRGHRIELGEIDACLGQQPGVGHCATTLHEDGGGRQWLCAFYTVTGNAPEVGQLGKALGARLPAAMVPALYIVQPSLPLTASGKVDRRRLPDVAPYIARLQQRGDESLDDVEQQVAGVWMALLELAAPPSRHANFFELGANSLLMVQARDRLATRFGGQLGVVDLFEHPTIAALAAHLRTGASPRPDTPTTPPPSAAAAAGRRAHLQQRATRHAAAARQAQLDTEETP